MTSAITNEMPEPMIMNMMFTMILNCVKVACDQHNIRYGGSNFSLF